MFLNRMGDEDKAWLEYRKKFSEIYDKSNYSSLLQSFVMHSSHKLLEKKYEKRARFSRVLEVGAGTGEHFSFVRHKFDLYLLTDIDSKALDVAKEKLATNLDCKVGFEVQGGGGLTYSDNAFDRLVAAHVLEHLYQPHVVIKEWRRVVRRGGIISILIPTDPGLAWRLGRRLGPRKSAVKQGIAYDYVMAREHVNSCNNLIALLRHYFPLSEESWWPFPIPSIDLNLFFAFHATVNKP